MPGTIRGLSEPFAPTQWSVVLAAGESQSAPEAARTALAQLCQTYWPPLYTFVRSRGYGVHDAQDLTQSFFAHLIEHKLYARADRQKGKFRSFLLASLKNLLADAHDRAQTLKRGGGREFLPLNDEQAEQAESLYQTHSGTEDSASEDRVYERSWAETLVTAALARLAVEYQAEGKEKLFANLKIFLTGGADPLPTYAELSVRLSAPDSSLRSDVTRLRSRYREALWAEVRRTVERESDVESELRELLRVLTSQ
ncbi:MAG: RNA polymerase sigma factor [Chthoniobacterales bacterium]